MSEMTQRDEVDWLRAELQRSDRALAAHQAHAQDVILGFEVGVAALQARIGEMEQQLRDQSHTITRLQLETVTSARLHQRAGLHLAAGLLEDEAYAIAAEEIAREATRGW